MISRNKIEKELPVINLELAEVEDPERKRALEEIWNEKWNVFQTYSRCYTARHSKARAALRECRSGTRRMPLRQSRSAVPALSECRVNIRCCAMCLFEFYFLNSRGNPKNCKRSLKPLLFRSFSPPDYWNIILCPCCINFGCLLRILRARFGFIPENWNSLSSIWLLSWKLKFFEPNLALFPENWNSSSPIWLFS